MLANFYPYQIWLDIGQTRDQLIKNIYRDLQTFPTDKTVLVVCYEYWSIEDIKHIVSAVTSEFTKHRLLWVFPESMFFNNVDVIDSLSIEYVFIDIDTLHLHFEINVFKISTLNHAWNNNTGKFLFLTGKPDRSNRIKLLYMMYQRGMLDQAVWSFFTNQQLEQRCRQLLPDVSDSEYKKFVNACYRSADNRVPEKHNNGQLILDGVRFNSDMYQQTSFRVISETQMKDVAILTEKTWTTIANNHPFIMAGYPGLLTFLEHYGFETYTDDLLYPNYDLEQNENQRFELVIKNTNYWLETISSKQINEKTKHNAQLLDKFMQDNVKSLSEVYKQVGQPDLELFRLFPGPTNSSKWVNFYYAVKDPRWPDCYDERDFFKLPKQIQDECCQTFGYVPKTLDNQQHI
jgi:hypothetical protein